MKTDIQIAQEAEMLHIREVAAKVGIEEEDLEFYGKYKAKLSDELMERVKDRPDGKLVLVTAINPTPAGEGKTTITVGLGEAMAKLGKKALIALREPSLGPCFGIKGGAEGQTLGRLAAEVAKVLRGKNKPEFTPHIDTGDNVIVINAEKIKVTGKKLDQKVYYHHSDYVGGMKETTLREMMAKKPEQVIELAVKGMLPKGPLGRTMIKKLHVYAGAEHAHQAQKPEVLTF